jgi:hypothetical protein
VRVRLPYQSGVAGLHFHGPSKKVTMAAAIVA